MHPLTIRKAGWQDLKSLVQLYRELEVEPETEPPMDKIADAFQRIGEYPNYVVYIAERNGRPVGTISLLIMDNLAHGALPSGIIEDLVVEPSSRGQGIGRRLMDFAMEICRTHGCYKMVLSSNQAREEAHRFYERLGYSRHGFSFRVGLPESGAENNG
jgi:GNAT superfamily N-acetyltransferase